MYSILGRQLDGHNVRRFYCSLFRVCSSVAIVCDVFFGWLYGVRQRNRSRGGGAEDENNTPPDTSVRCRVLVAVCYVTEFAGRRSRRRDEFSGRRSLVAGLSLLHGGAAAGLSSPGEPSSGGVRRATEPPPGGRAAAGRSCRAAEPPGDEAAAGRGRAGLERSDFTVRRVPLIFAWK